MKARLVKFILSLSSFSGILLFLLIGNQPDVPLIGHEYLNSFYGAPKYALCIGFVTLFAYGALKLTEILSTRDSLAVDSIQPMEGHFLPAYIGLFVIALELDSSFSFENIILLSLLFIFWLFLENVSYFNPFFLLFGYRFYEVVSGEGKKFTVITKKKDLKDIQKFSSLIRISNFSYIER